MDEMLRFLGVMSALSASSQTMTLQLKKRLRWLKFDEPQGDNDKVDHALVSYKKGKFHANVHLVCGINGAVLAALGNIHPLALLGLTPIWANAESEVLASLLDYTSAGVLVAYGGPWFHEFLGILREYKKSLRGNA